MALSYDGTPSTQARGLTMRILVLIVGIAIIALGAWELTQNPSTNYARCFNPQDCAYPSPSWIDTASSGLWGSALVGIGTAFIIIGLVSRRHPSTINTEETQRV
ncbi:MAG: hypothetical protein OK452_10710 [Thaumarchaeota archaeon]|nr:hypothetical protein [Nitrososphaerota archaeon]